MRVIPIAQTQFHYWDVEGATDYKPHEWESVDLGELDGEKLEAKVQTVSGLDELAEFSGRNCYQSWSRPNPKTATNEGYLANILKMGHESVLEHSSVTFFVEGVSRALLAELTRHRHLSFSVVSQRYVDANNLGNTTPPIVDELDSETSSRVTYLLDEADDKARENYEAIVQILVEKGFGRKQAREAARAVLPNSVESPMVVTGNLRAWRDVLKKRHHEAADKELQEFAREVLAHVRRIAPHSVQDIPEELYS